jgi:hypothetical protein
MEDEYNLPPDWENPEWSAQKKIHNWHNYVDDQVRVLWFSLSDEVRQKLAINFNNIADQEEWD